MNDLIKIDEFIFSLIPGTEDVEWTADSQYLNDIAEYHVHEIFDCLSIYQDVEILNDSNDVYERKLIWKNENRSIEIHFSTFDGANHSSWGGSGLSGVCTFDDILNLWIYLKKHFPRVWLHDRNCSIYSVDAFKAAFFE